MLATGSADSSVHLWTLLRAKTDTSDSPSDLSLTPLGHTKGAHTLKFNPTAADVLCSTSHDLSLYFQDVETGLNRVEYGFSSNGALLATASR